jgi:hypothetical protein
MFALGLACLLLLAPVLSQGGVVVALDIQSLTVKPLGKSEYEAGFQVGVLTQNRPWDGRIAYRAVVSRGSYQQTFSGESAARRGVNFDSFRFAIPTTEKEGPFKLRLEVSADGQGAAKETAFEHTVALPIIAVGGPEAIVEGEPCTLVARVVSGTPPYRWNWKAGDRSGQAEGPELVVPLPDARFPKMICAVWLLDGVHTEPVYAYHTVRVDKPTPVTERTPLPGQVDVVARISGPAEAAVGRKVVLTGSASGGSPPYSFQWVGDRPGGTGESCPLTFQSPGSYTVKLLASDSRGAFGVTTWNLQIYPRLTAEVAAPAGALSGHKVQFAARVEGGKPPYTYAWTTSGGGSGSGPTLSGTLRGKPGDSRQVKLVVKDSLEPPQSATATATVYVRGGSAPISGGLRFVGNLNPATVAFSRSLIQASSLGNRRVEDLRVKAPELTLTVAEGTAVIAPEVVVWEEHHREVDARGSRQKSTLHRFQFLPGRLGAGGRLAGPCRVTTRSLVDGQGPPETTRDTSWAVIPGGDGNLYLMPNYPNLPPDFLEPSFSLTPQQQQLILIAPYLLRPAP